MKVGNMFRRSPFSPCILLMHDRFCYILQAAFLPSTNPKVSAPSLKSRRVCRQQLNDPPRASFLQIPAARGLSLIDDWSLSLESATQIEGQGISLVYSHGGGGTPNYKIYGQENFGEGDLIGETCRSKGGQQKEAPLGMIIMTTPGDGGVFSIDVDFEKSSLDSIFIHDYGDTAIIQYCVYVSLVNPESNEDATYVETEIRFKLLSDSSITVDSFEPTLAQPETMDYTVTMNGLRAEICKVPSSPGDVVSVCINSTESAQTIVTVDSFVFETGGGISQVAFEGGEANGLTEVVHNDGASFQFNTLLKADFFRMASSKVTGQGTCTLSAGGRKLLDLGVNETDVPLELAFYIGQDPSSTSDRSDERDGVPNNTKYLSSSTQSGMYVATLIIAMLALVSMMIIGLVLYRRGRGEIRNDSPPTTPLETEDDPFDELKWV
jgi:hypothetical protein